MKTNWPQITMMVLIAMKLWLYAVKDGEPRDGNYKFSVKIMETALIVWITWAGGFWS
jgi:hypothetical protein